jgi:hypothetical protein
LPLVQSVVEVHDVLQDVAPHANALHEVGVTVWQTPAPSQVRAGVYVDPLQDSGTQVVPEVYRRQAPAPSHWPSSPQLSAVSAVHSSSGSVPPLTARQRPFVAPVFVLAQALQAPVHADSQQTLSTQLPVAHSTDAVQATP